MTNHPRRKAKSPSARRGKPIVLPAHSKPLRRGEACGPCRARKLKCDALKPSCGSCRFRESECFYGACPKTVQLKTLAEENAFLKIEVELLKNSAQYSDSVQLHDPYAPQLTFEDVSRGHLSLHIPEHIPFDDSSLELISPSSAASSLPSSISTWARRTSSPDGSFVAGYEEPSYLISSNLIDVFLPHATQFGFALEPLRFRESALLPLPLGDHQKPTPALLTVVLFLGSRISRATSAPMIDEDQMLKQALHCVANDLNSDHPNRMLHTLQSHILLAQYFFSTGDPLYAELHSSNAVAIALRCGLHKIRSANPPSPSAAVGLVNEQPTSFEYASDPVEEGERIQVFWYCFNLHKTITVATQHEDQLCGTLESYSSRIDTPWPEEMVSYEQEDVSTRTMGSRTIDNFLPHNPSILTTGTSLVALLAKASFLFHRTAYVASKHSMNHHNPHYFINWNGLDNLINTVRSQVPQLPLATADIPKSRLVILIHTLLESASINLQKPFIQSSMPSRQSCVASAQKIVQYGQMALQDTAGISIPFNPIMGYMWMNACEMLVEEISRAREAVAMMVEDRERVEILEQWYGWGLGVMSGFADDVLLRFYLTKTQEVYNSIPFSISNADDSLINWPAF